MSRLDDVLDAIAKTDTQQLRWEIKKLYIIRDWAIKQACDFKEGDTVEISKSLAIGSDSGWWCYREALAPGARATVQGIDYNTHYGYWYADIVLDREWSVAAFPSNAIPSRYWNGPADETPEGYTPPTKFDQEKYPEGRKHTFSMPVRHLQKIKPLQILGEVK